MCELCMHASSWQPVCVSLDPVGDHHRVYGTAIQKGTRARRSALPAPRCMANAAPSVLANRYTIPGCLRNPSFPQNSLGCCPALFHSAGMQPTHGPSASPCT